MQIPPRQAAKMGPHAGAALLLAVSVVACGPDGDIGGPMVLTSGDPNTTSGSQCSLDGIVYAPDVDAPPATDARPSFSFFATSQAGMYSLPAGEHAPQPDPARGYGGDFGGLAGADEICSMLARRSNPGDQKIWRAFLSSPGNDTEARVDAIGRVGPGPWYDFNGVLLARNLEGLLPNAQGRPRGAASPLGTRFSDENGEEMWQTGVDNHDTLTGSNNCGRLYDDDASGVIATCDGWTSKTLHGKEGNLAGIGGQVPVGHSWPRAFSFGNAVGARWINDHTISGCEPGASTTEGQGAPAGDFRVGAGGGFGGFYCFALGATSPYAR